MEIQFIDFSLKSDFFLCRFAAAIYKNRRSITVRFLSNMLSKRKIPVQDCVALLLRKSFSDQTKNRYLSKDVWKYVVFILCLRYVVIKLTFMQSPYFLYFQNLIKVGASEEYRKCRIKN